MCGEAVRCPPQLPPPRKLIAICAIIEPARVITGRASPSTTIFTVKILPSGVYHSLPRLVKPAACSNSVAACGSGFHQPMPKDFAISLGSFGI